MAERKKTTSTAEPEASASERTDRPEPAASATEAAPLEAPPAPERGNADSSTNFVAASAALRSPPGATHLRLVGDDGKPISADGVFTFPETGRPGTVAVVRQRTYEAFTPPNATTEVRQLLYPAGARVPVAQALNVVAALNAATAEVS